MRTLTQWSVADYQRMRNLGILDQRRCELINGDIVDMPPEREFHRFINDRGAQYMRRLLKDKAQVFEAHPITLAQSEPEPDIAIVRTPDIRYLDHHPYPEDIYWLIEVADKNLSYDLSTKCKLYAEAGIKEYWVIDVAKRQLTAFRELQNSEFSARNTLKNGIIYPVTFPDIAVEVEQLVTIPEA